MAPGGFQPLTNLFGDKPSNIRTSGTMDDPFDAILDPLTAETPQNFSLPSPPRDPHKSTFDGGASRADKLSSKVLRDDLFDDDDLFLPDESKTIDSPSDEKPPVDPVEHEPVPDSPSEKPDRAASKRAADSPSEKQIFPSPERSKLSIETPSEKKADDSLPSFLNNEGRRPRRGRRIKHDDDIFNIPTPKVADPFASARASLRSGSFFGDAQPTATPREDTPKTSGEKDVPAENDSEKAPAPTSAEDVQASPTTILPQASVKTTTKLSPPRSEKKLPFWMTAKPSPSKTENLSPTAPAASHLPTPPPPPTTPHHISAEQAALVEDLKNTVEELKKQIEVTAASQGKAAQELREAKEAAAKAVELREEQHRGSLEALRAVHSEELESMRRRFADADRLAAAEAKLENAVTSFANLQTHISDRAKGLDVAQDAQLDARKRLVDDMELSAREARKQSETETVKLQSLLTGMDSVMQGVRSLSAHEHERLYHEQARLSSLQDALHAQATASREAIALESAHLRARVATQESAYAKRQDEILADRAALEVERDELVKDRAELERARERLVKDCELQKRTIAKKEEALLQLQRHVEQQSVDLDRKVETTRALMIDADARDEKLRGREQRVQIEMKRLLDMHVELEEATRVVAERNSHLDVALHQAAQAQAEGERSQNELAVRQAELSKAQAAVADEAQKRHAEHVKLVREKTQLIKARRQGLNMLKKHTTTPIVGRRVEDVAKTPESKTAAAALVTSQHTNRRIECPPSKKPLTVGAPSIHRTPTKAYSWKAEMIRLRAAAARSQAHVREQEQFLNETGCV